MVVGCEVYGGVEMEMEMYFAVGPAAHFFYVLFVFGGDGFGVGFLEREVVV